MSRLQFYFNTHLKSLLISKFNFQKKEISKISFKNISVKLKFLKQEYISLDLKWLFFFFITNQWPLVKIKYYFLKGKKTLRLSSFETTLRNKMSFIFLDKLILTSFVNFENWSGIKKTFKLKIYSREFLNELIFLIQDLNIFWELEYLIRSPLKAIKKETENCLIVIKFLFFKKNLLKNLNVLRCLQFPVFFSEKTKF